MTIDFTINLGHIITLVGTLIAFITWGNGIKWHITAIDTRVENIEKQLAHQTQLMITTSILTDRLASLEKRIEAVDSVRRRSNV